MKKYLTTGCLTLLMVLFFGGCSLLDTSDKKISDVYFTVVSSDQLPEEVTALIEERKNEAFQMAYSDGQYTYIIIGYGAQSTGGYSIQVNDVYLGEESLWVDTDLIGPEKTESQEGTPSYPYVVIKIEMTDMTIQLKK